MPIRTKAILHVLDVVILHSAEEFSILPSEKKPKWAHQAFGVVIQTDATISP
jgi:hypothetical protein